MSPFNILAMKLKFAIHYITVWGLHLAVRITCYNTDGNVVRRQIVDMKTDDGELWYAESVVTQPRNKIIDYFEYDYIVCDDDEKVLREEWNKVPRRYHADMTKDYILPDLWRDVPSLSHLYTDVYTTVAQNKIYSRNRYMPMALFGRTVIFKVSAPQLTDNQEVGVLGSNPILGNWIEGMSMPMTYCGCYDWVVAIDVTNITLPLEYKYVVTDKHTHQFLKWEDGDNRVTGKMIDDGQVLIEYGEPLRTTERPWKAAGISIPVFSLRSEHSFGTGDFGDLKRLIDWAVVTGMKIIQLLPVNDTTTTRSWTDSYPYNIISVKALHPQYLNIEALGELKDKDIMRSYRRQQQELNGLSEIDYEAVSRVKEAYVRAIFEETGADVMASDDYKSFFDNNKEWLKPYAVFRLLRDKYHTARYSDWKTLQTYNYDEVENMCKPSSSDYREICLIFYVQYHLYIQLREAAIYARHKGVALMGDLPIGVSRDSAEAWKNPELFNLDSQTGTPPDKDNRSGQNWNFPTYNWNVMMSDRCQWMRNRLGWMEQFFDAVRIDHVLGFFRIWEIPVDAVQGVLGHFAPALPLTTEEIGRYGITFRKELYTRPMINEEVLTRVFGLHAPYVRDTFLEKKSYGMYALKSGYDTQVKVRDYFGGRNDENSVWIRDGLYRLIGNVLFVEDPRQRGLYHPRVNAYNEPIFQALSADDKESYMRLYNHFFYQRHNEFWSNEALLRLPAVLRDTCMMVCAEDLGMLPDCVEPTLDLLKILKLEIQRMPKNPNYDFGHLDENPYNSMVTTSTHDMAPMRLWWEENSERRQSYYVTMLQKEGHAPRQLPAWMAEEIVKRHLYCPSMLCVLPFQDWMATDQELRNKNAYLERINVPSDCYNRWSYRMHITLEKLMREEKFNHKLKNMINLARR